MQRPRIVFRGPVLNASDVGVLARFYEQLLGWQLRDLVGPRPGGPPGDGWAMLVSDDGTLKLEIQFDEHLVPPVWPGQAGTQNMQLHLDFRVEDVPTAVEWALSCGAKQAEPQPANRDPNRLRVMLDPSGHPLCLFS
jgi:catechol 2,3-dioxygenase-like lactoylglutathione lyase family enzyme